MMHVTKRWLLVLVALALPLVGLVVYGAEPLEPMVLELGQELRGMELIRYWVKDHLRMSEGAVELDLVLRFAAEKKVTLDEIGSSGKASHTFLTFILEGGNRICVMFDRLRGAVLLYAHDKATKRHLIIETFAVTWREGEAHSVRFDWGESLALRLDRRLVFSAPWRGLSGPWNQTEPGQAYVLVGSIRMWAHTQSDFRAERITFHPRSYKLHEALATVDAPPGIDLPQALLTIPRLAAAPVIDGVVTDAEWARAASVTGLTNVQSMMAMPDGTVFCAGYDDARLYVGFRAERRQAQLIDAACHVRDGAVYLDDAVEVFLRPGGAGPYYQFIGNGFDTIYDGFDGKSDWDGAWHYKAHQGDSFWSGEVSIAFAELGRSAPQPGEVWTVNFCRELPKMSEIASWSMIHRYYSQPDRFATAVFAATDTVGVTDISGHERGRVVMHGHTTTPVRAQLVLADGLGELQRATTDLGSGAFVLEIAAPERVTAGEYLLTYDFRQADGTVLQAGSFPFTTLSPFSVALRKYPSYDYVEAIVDVRGMSSVPGGAAARALLLNASGEELQSEQRLVSAQAPTCVLRLSTAGLDPGGYTVRGQLCAAAGKGGQVLDSADLTFEELPRPWWQGSEAGVTEGVLPPWTPMTVDGTTIGCWGRAVEFGRSVLPEQITSQGQELLAAPMRLVGRTTNGAFELRAGSCRVTQSAAHAVDLSADSADGALRVECDIHAEYDGMVRFDVTLSAVNGLTLERLTLEIPLRAEHSILMHENNGSRGWAGLTGDEPRSMVFRPVLWLGDDYRGLCWFAESAQGWAPAADGAVTIERQGDVRVLRLHMIREAMALERPLSYTFGLMPTPVRPLPEHVRDWRLATAIGKAHSGGAVVLSERIVYQTAGQLDNRQGSLELWLRPEWPTTGRDELYSVWLQIASVEYGPFPGKSHLDLFYHPVKAQFVLNHTRTVTEPATKQRRREEKAVFGCKSVGLVRDRTAHIALTWGQELALFLDGQELAKTTQSGLIPGESAEVLPDEVLVLGARDEWKGRTAFTFDELRVSSRARTQAELQKARPVADDAVVLLDHFSESFRPDGEDGRTCPEVCVGVQGGGVPSVGCSFVSAEHGTGVRVVVASPLDWLEIARRRIGVTHALDWRWHKYMGLWEMLLGSDEYRQGVEGVHDAGLQYYVYTYKALPPRHRLHGDYFDEWGLLPRVRWLNPGTRADARNYDGDSTCCNSPYTDYFVASYERAVREYGLDGIYLDGSTKPSLCTNEHHGCGYRDGAGELRGTYPIFATREMLKRLYAVTHLSKPQGIVDVHESFCLCIPTTSFCDVIYTGEHEPFSPERVHEVRVRYGWRAWGMPIEVLGNTPNHVRFAQRYWAYMLIHDARVRPAGAQARNDMQRKTANIRRILEPFRGPECTWMPYYEPSPFRAMDEGLYVSAWGRPQGDYLLAVAYFGRKPERIVGRISTALSGRWRATNPLTEQACELDASGLRVPIAFECFRLIHLVRAD